jgi:sulfite exporter TauE/SafE
VNQYFAHIAAELPVMALSAKVYVLLIVTIKEGAMRDWMNVMLSILLCTTPSLFVVHVVAAQVYQIVKRYPNHLEARMKLL